MQTEAHTESQSEREPWCFAYASLTHPDPDAIHELVRRCHDKNSLCHALYPMFMALPDTHERSHTNKSSSSLGYNSTTKTYTSWEAQLAGEDWCWKNWQCKHDMDVVITTFSTPSSSKASSTRSSRASSVASSPLISPQTSLSQRTTSSNTSAAPSAFSAISSNVSVSESSNDTPGSPPTKRMRTRLRSRSRSKSIPVILEPGTCQLALHPETPHQVECRMYCWKHPPIGVFEHLHSHDPQWKISVLYKDDDNQVKAHHIP